MKKDLYIPTALLVTLSIFTLGVFALYWYIIITDRIEKATADTSKIPSGIVCLFLAFTTFGIYALYWIYAQSERIDKIRLNHGCPKQDYAILNLIVAVFALPPFSVIISFAIMQNSLNGIYKTPYNRQNTNYNNPQNNRYTQKANHIDLPNPTYNNHFDENDFNN